MQIHPFFHQQERYRKKKNFISKLQVEDRLYISQDENQEVGLISMRICF